MDCASFTPTLQNPHLLSILRLLLGTVFGGKECILSGIAPITSSSQFENFVQLFSDVQIQDLKVSLGRKTLCILYTQKQFKVQIIGILEKKDSVYY